MIIFSLLKTIIYEAQVDSWRSYDSLLVMLKKLMNPRLKSKDLQYPTMTISEWWGCQKTLISLFRARKFFDATETSVPDSDSFNT